MRLLVTLFGLLLAGCLTSSEPLIVAGDFPFPPGTMVEKYGFSDGRFVPAGSDALGRLSIRDGWYLHQIVGKDQKAATAFRLKRVDDSTYLAMIRVGGGFGAPELTYGWLRREGNLFALYVPLAKHFKEWARRVGLGPSGWREVESNIQFSSVDLLVKALPAMVGMGLRDAPTGYRLRPATPREVGSLAELRKLDDEQAALKRKQATLKSDLARLEAELKKLCGGRVCRKASDGREIYRTETYDPPRWYYQDGRLAPRSEWPK